MYEFRFSIYFLTYYPSTIGRHTAYIGPFAPNQRSYFMCERNRMRFRPNCHQRRAIGIFSLSCDKTELNRFDLLIFECNLYSTQTHHEDILCNISILMAPAPFGIASSFTAYAPSAHALDCPCWSNCKS